MRFLFFALALPTVLAGNAQTPAFLQVKAWEEKLADVTEITDTAVLQSLILPTESAYQNTPNTFTQARLGMLYHEVALNLGFLTKTTFKGYAKKSYNLLHTLSEDPHLPAGLRPFVLSYEASALALVGGETRKLSFVGKAFKRFQEAVDSYGNACWAPLFLRGSVAENLPLLFWRKKRFAGKDFSRMIQIFETNADWAPAKIKSFTYWAWAAQHPQKKYRTQALGYLQKAVALDPNGTAGNAKAQALLQKWQ